jgi:alpha-beta hydrolase superfamily lysophospholipase
MKTEEQKIVPRYTIEEFQAGDGYLWHYRRYAPTRPVKAQVVCVHGIQSHGGWYEHSCQRLSDAGFSVCFLDRRGAGLNPEARGDTPSFRRLLDDLAEFIRFEKKRFMDPDATTSSPSSLAPSPPRPFSSSPPLFLIAISWGGKLAVALEHRHPDLVDALVLISPGFVPKVRPPLWQRMGIAAARLASPRKLFPIPLNDPELFTGNPRWQKFIQEDPLSLRQATARFLVESARLDTYLRLFVGSVRIPLLVFLAGHDRIIDTAKTRRFVERLNSRDKKLVEYPEAHHTLEFEANPEPFFGDLVHWLEKHAETPR